MKKILIFSLAYAPFLGGVEVAIQEITRRIPQADIEFHVITLRFDSALPRHEKIGAVQVHRIGWGERNTSVAATFGPLFYLSKILFVPLAARAGVLLHKKYHFDAAWAMMSYMTFPLMLMRIRGVRLPYALTLQEGDTFKKTFLRARIRLVMPLLRAGFRKATVVQAISNYLGRWARTMGFRGPLEIIPNGVDVGRFSTVAPGARTRLRQQWGIHESERLLVTVSRLVQKNAVDVIVRSLSMLPPGVHLLVCGEGPELRALQVLARELGVVPRVHFAGTVSQEHLPEYLYAADIFVRPSRSEGMGNSFIEAMASGIPVIATQEGGIADFLFDSQRNAAITPTGFAVDVDSPQQIAAAVEKIMGDPGASRRVIENARRMVEERYDWNRIALQMREEVFGRVLKNRYT